MDRDGHLYVFEGAAMTLTKCDLLQLAGRRTSALVQIAATEDAGVPDAGDAK